MLLMIDKVGLLMIDKVTHVGTVGRAIAGRSAADQ
jgi:hypothetical protein